MVRDHDSEIEHLKLLHQQSVAALEKKAIVHQQGMAANQQSLQHLMAANQQLAATLAELVQLVPVFDRSIQLQQQIASIHLHPISDGDSYGEIRGDE